MEKLSQTFVHYVTDVTGQSVAWGQPVPAHLPQYLAQRYSLFQILIGRKRFLGIVLEDDYDFRPAAFEKHVRHLMAYAGELESYCLIARDLPGYVRHRLVQRGIPFVVPNLQLYWPDLGLAVQSRKAKNAPVPVDTLSPAAQAVLIYALNSNMPEPVTSSVLAAKLAYTSMTMSRALDEIEANNIGRVERYGRARLLDFPEDRQSLWKKALPFMRSPVRETVRIKEGLLPPELRIVAGEPALADMSMLAPPKEPVYALGRKNWKKIAGTVDRIPVEDEGTCRVQLWRYDPALFSKEGKVDIFSLYLSLSEEDDERIESALQEMMENFAWS
ncbi:MAG TPA: hypothetical protein P5244_08665 [Syntrophales bacterium]|jgi:hypothetical protein|nr:transcriptional regulator [Deltaproteobacteria bacterium]HRR41288.1 hypothetical protein [Syntrophales bacterium]